MEFNKIKERASNNKTLLANFSYMSVLQLLLLLTPLITYPYLTRVLGMELYGFVITAQILAGYATLIVKFGFDSVSARHVSIYRDDKVKLSEIISSILTMRLFLWLTSFVVYLTIVMAVPIYRSHFLLFMLSFGLTLNILLFPQFYFQGIEKMKYITFINIVVQSIFIGLIFILIRTAEDYYLVPLLHAVGYAIGGGISLYIIFKVHDVNYKFPTMIQNRYYFKDALPLFATDAICTIKDKLNYLLLGVCVNMADVVVYDMGSKLSNLAIQPLQIINTVVFPKMAKDKNDRQFKQVGMLIFSLVFMMTVVVNIFLSPIVHLLTGVEIDLLPIRLYLLSPLFLGISSFVGSSLIVARGYNKFMLYSILVTTSVYIGSLLLLFIIGHLNTVMSFIGLTVISYLAELMYRIYVAKRIIDKKVKLI